MINYSCVISTVNLNAIQTRIKKSLLGDFIRNTDSDIVFCQEVAFRNFSFVSSHDAIVNVGPN